MLQHLLEGSLLHGGGEAVPLGGGLPQRAARRLQLGRRRRMLRCAALHRSQKLAHLRSQLAPCGPYKDMHGVRDYTTVLRKSSSQCSTTLKNGAVGND